MTIFQPLLLTAVLPVNVTVLIGLPSLKKQSGLKTSFYLHSKWVVCECIGCTGLYVNALVFMTPQKQRVLNELFCSLIFIYEHVD